MVALTVLFRCKATEVTLQCKWMAGIPSRKISHIHLAKHQSESFLASLCTEESISILSVVTKAGSDPEETKGDLFGKQGHSQRNKDSNKRRSLSLVLA